MKALIQYLGSWDKQRLQGEVANRYDHFEVPSPRMDSCALSELTIA